MDVEDAIYKRRSIRAYEGTPIDKEVLDSLLNAALEAPSAGNVQPYRIYVITDLNMREELARASLNQWFIAEAPINLVFTVNIDEAYSAYGERGVSLYSILDVGAAIENLMLLATSYGLGTCWIGAFDEEEVSKLLNLPSNERPISIVTLGYPRIERKRPKKKTIREVVVWR